MISLVLPTYNGEKYLREQLDSIYAQTMIPDEVIVVDDRSTDTTVDILKEYQILYGLEYFINDNNLGYNKNFEKGIQLSKGDYICLCDQDDVWFPSKIETLYKKLKEIENDSPACVSSNVMRVDTTLNPVSSKQPYFEESEFESAIFGFASQGCTMMLNRKLWRLIKPIPPGFIYDEYIGELSAFVGNRYCLGLPLMFYRIHSGNAIGTQLTGFGTRFYAGRIVALLKPEGRLRRLHYYLENYSKYCSTEKKQRLSDCINAFSYKSILGKISKALTFPGYSFGSRLMAALIIIKSFFFNHKF